MKLHVVRPQIRRRPPRIVGNFLRKVAIHELLTLLESCDADEIHGLCHAVHQYLATRRAPHRKPSKPSKPRRPA